MAVPCAPDSLLRLPLAVFAEVARAVGERDRDRWTWETELAAVNAEVTHALYAAFVAVHARKGSPPVEPLRIERPGRRDADEPQGKTVSGDELMHWLGGA